MGHSWVHMIIAMPLWGLVPSRSQHTKCMEMAIVLQGRMQLSSIEDHMQEGLGACSPKASFEIRCSMIASEAMFEPKFY